MATQVSPGVNISELDLTTTVPGVATSVGAISGLFRWGPVGQRVTVNSETNLVSIFGRPTSLNAETFLTAANFLGYSTTLSVVRAADTTSANSTSTYNSVANTAAFTVANCVVKNTDDYNNRTNFEAGALYVAKYPGAIGNSLRISICDSATAYSSNLALIGSLSSNTITGSAAFTVGSNTAVLSFVSSSNVTLANTYANTVVNTLIIGDLIPVGNATLGTQYMTVTSLGTPSANATVASVNVGFSDVLKLAANFTYSNTVNGNTSVVNVNRVWQYYASVSSAPITSNYVASFGNTAAVDTLHVVVVDQDGLFGGTPGAILETFPNLSRATDAKSNDGASIYYKTVLANNSKYIWQANDRANAISNTAINVTTSTNLVPLTLDLVSGQDGLDEGSIPFTVIASGYDLFKLSDQIDVSLIIQGKPIGGSSGAQLANYLIDNIAELRKDCMVLVSPPDTITKNNVGLEASSIVSWKNINLRDSTYAVVDTGYKYMYDRYNDVYRYVPLNGDIAGIIARTEMTNDAWWSPAGFNRGQIKNIIKLRYNPSKADRDVLYSNSINPVVTFPGAGTVLYGDKTATMKPSSFGQINVRRLFINLERAIAASSKFSLFEFNDDFTRSQFKNLITPYLREVQGRRGITDFLVVCDTTNNTPARINNGEFWGDIYVKPNHSINYIQLNFVAVRSGVDFNTIIGAAGNIPTNLSNIGGAAG
jgi:phage tail sheath protein FI